MVLIRLAGGDFKVPKRIFGQEIPITSRYGSRISPFHSKTIRSHRTKGLEKAQTTLNHDTNISNSRLIWNNLLHWTISQRTREFSSHAKSQYGLEVSRDDAFISRLKIVQRLQFLGFRYIHELDAFIEENLEGLKALAEKWIEKARPKVINEYSMLVYVILLASAKDAAEMYQEQGPIQGLQKAIERIQ